MIRKKIKPLVAKKIKRKKQSLVTADGSNSFWVHQGPVLRSLVDLVKFLEIITAEQFAYHGKRNSTAAGTDGNDFSRWVAEVLQDKTCAMALARAKTSVAALRAVRRGLTRYNV